MRTIRSLLWIGSGRALSESGVTEAPELDVTWVPSVGDAVLLPKVEFDGLLFEVTDAATIHQSLDALARYAPGTPVVVCLPDSKINRSIDLTDGRVTALLFTDSARSGPGIVSQINEALDDLRTKSTRPAGATVIPIENVDPWEERDVDPFDGEAPPQVIAKSTAMQEVSKMVELAASSPSTVLLTGETGVGKEVIARQLHHRSDREGEPFVAINCAAFPESLLESELFGHLKGAFTGADRVKEGLFLAAGSGTLFLDEIAEMSLSLQAKLLRVLQEREIRPVGATKSSPIHCRIVAATNRVLAEEVCDGHFREDLFYRLNVFPIQIPPLRRRRIDIMPLAHYFLALHAPREGKAGCHLSLASRHLLEGYGWPGNVRELENEMLRALMLTPSGELITPKMLSPKIIEILEPISHGARPDETLREALDRVEAWMIRRALTNNGGRKARTARKLGLTREGLYKKIKRLGVE
ncbi:MAG: sigma 54-interacting transcriptional regulator [Myxococcales bacterium]|nr:AAA family ATPase [Myxococcales bacterium]HIK86279.1 AAA family ATPase [Myxococcales bacterium]